jgi:RimJ/RimL family protein N-acetyltransferase
MEIKDPLFEGKTIRLSSINYEKDAEIESKWTHDPETMRLLRPEPVRPLTPAQVKKKYEAIEKEEEESKSLFHFTIRLCEDDRLVGIARLNWVDWANGNAHLSIAIGDPADQGHGYDAEALNLLMNYAFTELNLYRLSAEIVEFNEAGLQLFRRAGFVEEVCRRQAQDRSGQRWDVLHLGILRSEWEALAGALEHE